VRTRSYLRGPIWSVTAAAEPIPSLDAWCPSSILKVRYDGKLSSDGEFCPLWLVEVP